MIKVLYLGAGEKQWLPEYAHLSSFSGKFAKLGDKLGMLVMVYGEYCSIRKGQNECVAFTRLVLFSDTLPILKLATNNDCGHFEMPHPPLQ